MPSFEQVNYALRPSKTIERLLAFESVRQLMERLPLENMLYVGFGSIWFVDFQIAHKSLGLRDSVSIEADRVGYARAKFNRPFSTCTVVNGLSGDVIPRLLKKKDCKGRPWLVWLDFDYELNSDMMDEIRTGVEDLPENSIFLVTLSAKGRRYGQPKDRRMNLKRLLGNSLDIDLEDDAFDEYLTRTLADGVLDFMSNAAVSAARPGGFLPAFRLIYNDTSPMITVGGVLPSKGSRSTADDVIDGPAWSAWEDDEIRAPHLTWLEASALQQLLPKEGRITKQEVIEKGFDLSVEQLKAFSKFYRYYPTFAQVSQ